MPPTLPSRPPAQASARTRRLRACLPYPDLVDLRKAVGVEAEVAGPAGEQFGIAGVHQVEGPSQRQHCDAHLSAGVVVVPERVALASGWFGSRSHVAAAVVRREGQAAMTRPMARTPRPASPVGVRCSPSTASPRTAATAGSTRPSVVAVVTAVVRSPRA